jgi:hypothetical protein
MKELTDLISNATEGINGAYFHLNIDGGDPVYRERVYCYELYHQLRILLSDQTEYYLNGEVDKAAHPILKELGADGFKPDFLIHRPGDMKGNNVIIEVKSENATRQGIKKDIETLSLFVNKVRYKKAIYLFFGYGLRDNGILRTIKSVASVMEKLAPIEIWFHCFHDKPAELVEKIGGSREK